MAAAAPLVVKQHDACIGATTFDFCHAATAMATTTTTTTTVAAADN